MMEENSQQERPAVDGQNIVEVERPVCRPVLGVRPVYGVSRSVTAR